MKINVTKPFLPPLEEFLPYLEKIWDSRILSNGGSFHQELELSLKNYLNVPEISLVNNATLGLIIGLNVLDLKGEVITTPFSFVATSHALIWSKLKPVFVDIKLSDFNIDPDLIESAITENTSAILAVHCYGNPCDVDKIENIAAKYKLKVIYDAAHAFGVNCHCGSLLSHGDISVLSFHATKVFNTFEGGAIICQNSETKYKIDKFKNFGYDGEIDVLDFGINAKMTEFSAALGLHQLKYLNYVIDARKKIDATYRQLLSQVKGIKLNSFSEKSNYSYFPILINEDFYLDRDSLYEHLKKNNIYTRRYFYPLIPNLTAYKNKFISNGELKNAIDASRKIICLPIYPELKLEEVEFICKFFKKN